MRHTVLRNSVYGILAVLTLLAVVPPAAAAPAGWLTRIDEAFAQAAAPRDAGPRYILVDLYADWCGWCKVLEREVFADPEFVAWSRDFVLLWVDVEDGGEGSELQARFGAGGLPTTLILDSRQVKVGEVTGFHPTGRYIAALEAEIAAFRDLDRLYDRVRESGDPELQERLAADLHGRGDGARAAALYEALLARPATPDPATAAWLHYQAADAYRLGGDFSGAERHLERSRRWIRELGSPRSGGPRSGVLRSGVPALAEQLDLLSYRIAEDRGDCRAVVASLEHFLAEHPGSAYSRQARHTLKETKCT